MNQFFEWINSITPNYCPNCENSCCKLPLTLNENEVLPFLSLDIPVIHQEEIEFYEVGESYGLINQKFWHRTKQTLFLKKGGIVPLTVLIQTFPNSHTIINNGKSSKAEYILFKEDNCPALDLEQGCQIPFDKKPSVCQEYPLWLDEVPVAADGCKIWRNKKTLESFFEQFPGNELRIDPTIAKELGIEVPETLIEIYRRIKIGLNKNKELEVKN